MSNKHWKLEWQLKNMLDWSLIDPKTRIVLESMLRIVFDYLNEK